jgi:phosphonate transport system substrate-binding protein
MRSRQFAGALIALTLVAAACGGDDDTADAPDTTDAPPATDAPDITEAPPATDAPPATEAPPATDAPPATEAPDENMNPDWPEKLVFGFVPSQEQGELQDDIQPFIDVLEAALGIEVEGFVTTDYTGLVTTMGSGQTDLGAFGPFGYVLGKDNFGNIEALIQSVRFGSGTYHGQWFTNDPSICNEPPVEATALENQNGEIVQVPALDAVALQVGVFFGDDGKALGETVSEGPNEGAPISAGWSCIGDLSKVAGKSVAYTTETSTSGYLFPALELTELGIDPLTGVEATFTLSHDAAVVSVYNGDTEIGLSFDDARRTLRGEQPDVGEKVIVFSITDEIPNDVVAVRSDLPQDLKDAIYDAVESFLATDEGEEIFDKIYGWTDISRAIEADFDIVRAAANTLGITEPID